MKVSWNADADPHRCMALGRTWGNNLFKHEMAAIQISQCLGQLVVVVVVVTRKVQPILPEEKDAGSRPALTVLVRGGAAGASGRKALIPPPLPKNRR